MDSMEAFEFEAVYGNPPAELAEAPPAALRLSPLTPGAQQLEDMAAASCGDILMLAPAGAVERRYALALALRAMRGRARLVAMAPKDKGGARIAAELTALGCAVEETARRHHRICVAGAPGNADAIAAAIEAGAPRFVESLGLWSQPGVFSWDRLDPGSAMLLEHLPELKGSGADFGCGLGVLSKRVLASPAVSRLLLIDIDRRAIETARRNVVDSRAEFVWGDVRENQSAKLDFIVSNPPFHDAGAENRTLGQAFILRAAASLRTGGALWMVANRHMPYEATLKPAFARLEVVADASGYKIFRAQK